MKPGKYKRTDKWKRLIKKLSHKRWQDPKLRKEQSIKISKIQKGLYKILTKKFLKKEYLKNKKPTLKIAKKLNISDTIVNRYLKKYNIKLRPNHAPCIFKFTKNYLIKQYTIRKKSINQIAKQIGCKGQYIHEKMIKWNIERRTISEANSGKNNPMFGKFGKLHHHYIENLERTYPFIFWEIREIIRKRDHYTCQLCGIKQENYYRKLDVHHIDYNKQNCKEENLITLCLQCNLRVNFNRDYWYAYFMYITERTKI